MKSKLGLVLITGASAGIGEACARAFAAEGRPVWLVARRKDRLAALARELTRKYRVTVETDALDVSDRSAVAAWSKRRAKALASVEVLVNNAGLARGRGPMQEGRPEDWDEMIDTNVKGALYVLHAVIPGMHARGSGHIVNLGSVAGRWAYPGGNVYGATKAALRMVSESLRLDLHGSGVRVTEIAPGMVETEFSQVRFRGDEARARAVYAGFKPLTPADVADAIVWAVGRPGHVNIQEIVLYPTAQASVTMVQRRS